MNKIEGIVKFIMVVCLIGLILYLLEYNYSCGFNEGYINAESIYMNEINELTEDIEKLICKDLYNTSDFYYSEAHILSQIERNDGKIYIKWCVGEIAEIFETVEDEYLSRDFPYLLTMKRNDNTTTDDDEIVVIWQAIR